VTGSSGTPDYRAAIVFEQTESKGRWRRRAAYAWFDQWLVPGE